ncbi:MAG: collagen binding domain-containing protein [Sphingomicrobium sp.]
MSGGRSWLRKAAMLLALCAGSVCASAPPPQKAAAPWSPDPDEQFILDVNIRSVRLGDTVRAYNTPEGACVVLGDFLQALDVPMRIDLGAKKAAGWAFRESNRITIDFGMLQASFGGKRNEPIAPGTIRETPEGWCVQTTALTRWFGITVKPMTSGSVLLLESQAKLPIEMAIERQQRAARIHKASFDLSGLPQVRVPYRMWRTPALDFVVSGGVTYRAADGVRVDRQSSVYAAGEIAHLSYDAQVTTNAKGRPNLLRVRAFRSDPDGHLLGPLKATHVGVGDVEGFDSRLTGSVTAGRGAVLTNRPLAARTAFDRTHIEGDLPPGWEAELYRNGELLGFAKAVASQRYVFDDVQLLYGENRIRVILYGPQGQVKERDEVLNVGEDNVPAGKTWYWIGANQPGRDLVSLEAPADAINQPKAQAAMSLEHGLDSRTTVGLLARTMLQDDERLTFVEGTIRRSIAGAAVEISASRESNGGAAAHAQLLGKIHGVYVNVDALIANDFHLRGGDAETLREGRIALDAPVRIGKTTIPLHGDAHYVDRSDGTRMVEAAARLSANIDRFNLGAEARYHRDYVPSGPDPPGELTLGLLGSGHVGGIRIRSQADFDVSPSARFRSAELSAYWSASDRSDWEGVLAYDQRDHRARAAITHIVRVDSFAISVTGEAASDGSIAAGFNLNFSLDPRHGVSLSRRPLAEGGMVHATVFRDINDNGVRDPGEPLEKGALITTGTRQAERKTDSNGSVTVGGLTPYLPVTVGIDGTSLDDPMLTPKAALQVVIPRPGVPADVQIALVGGGDVEGALMKSGEIGFEGVDLELVDAGGKVMATARTDFDGFFMFDRIAYGRYTLRVNTASATAAKIGADLGLVVEVTPEKPVVRIGSIQPRPPVHIAAADHAAHAVR